MGTQAILLLAIHLCEQMKCAKNLKPDTDWNRYGDERCPSRNRLLFPEHRLTLVKFIEYFKNLDINLSVLDVGCGDGFWLEILRALGFCNLFGMDISYSFLKRAKSKGFRVVQYDVHSMGFRQKFDVVIMCDVLEHLPDVSKALNNVHDVLKETGILYLIVPVYDSLSSRFHRFVRRKSKIDEAQEHDETHLHAFSKRDITSLLNLHHFIVREAIYTANRLPFVTGKIQRLTFGNRFGNWLSVIAQMAN